MERTVAESCVQSKRFCSVMTRFEGCCEDGGDGGQEGYGGCEFHCLCCWEGFDFVMRGSESRKVLQEKFLFFLSTALSS